MKAGRAPRRPPPAAEVALDRIPELVSEMERLRGGGRD